MIHLGDVRVFLEVAATGSFSEAARRLRMPKSSVTRQVERLETALGRRLFARAARNVTLTNDGRDFIAPARRLYDNGIEAETLFRSATEGVAGRLTVSATGPFARAFLMPHLPAFLDRHPGLQVTLWLTPGRIEVGSGEGEVDIAIRLRSSAGADLANRKLGEIGFRLVAATAYVAQHGAPAVPDDLRDHRMVEIGPANKAHQIELRRGGEIATVRYAPQLHADDPEAACIAVAGGAGVAVVPDFLAEPLLASGKLMELLPGWAPSPIPVILLYRTDIVPPARVRAYVDYLFETIGDRLR